MCLSGPHPSALLGPSLHCPLIAGPPTQPWAVGPAGPLNGRGGSPGKESPQGEGAPQLCWGGGSLALRLGGTAVRAAEPAARSSLLSGVDLTFQTWPGCKLRRWQAHAHMCIYVHIRDTEHSRHELSSRRRPRKQTPKFTSLHQGPGTRDPLLQSHTFPHHGDAPGAPVHRGCCGGKACPLSPGEKDKGPRLPPPFPAPWSRQPVAAMAEAGGGRLSGPGSSFAEGTRSSAAGTPRQPGNLPLLRRELATCEPICFQAISLFPALLVSP